MQKMWHYSIFFVVNAYYHASNKNRTFLKQHLKFQIKHYAGQVWYNVEGFLDKNRDALRGDVLELLCSSEVPLVAEMSTQLRAQHDANKTLPRGANGRFVTMKPRTPTVAARWDRLEYFVFFRFTAV